MNTGDTLSSTRLTGWALAVWALALLAYIVAVINRGSLSALGPTAQDRFLVDATVLGTFAVMQLVLYAFLQIPVGIFVQRFGPTAIILLGAALMTLGQALLAVATDVWLIVLARVFVGMGDAGTFVSVLRVIANWLPRRQYPIWTQLTSQLGQLGQIVAVLPLALLVTLQGWTVAFLAVAAVTLLSALLVFLFVSDSPERKPFALWWTPREHPEAHDEPLGAALLRQFRGVATLWRLPGVRLSYWIHFTPPFAAGTFLLLWGFPFLVGGVGLDPSFAATLISMTAIIGIVFGSLIGPLTVRFRSRREEIVIGATLIIILSWGLVILWPGVPPLWTIMVLITCLGLGLPMSVVGFDVLRDHAPVRLISVGTGLINTGGFVSGLIAVFLIGFVLDLQDAGTPETYNLPAFKVAMSTQGFIWMLGLSAIIRNMRIVRSSRVPETDRA